MKKIALVAMMATLAFSASSFADSADAVKSDLKGNGSYGMAGCGLGSMLFQQDTTVNQVLAATTNGTFGSQTFGITTGTSNCTKGGIAKVEKETEMFVEVNYDVLQKEISQGNGETLASFSNLLGCSDSAVLSQGLQANYDKISTASDSSQFLQNVRATIAADQALSASCKI